MAQTYKPAEARKEEDVGKKIEELNALVQRGQTDRSVKKADLVGKINEILEITDSRRLAQALEKFREDLNARKLTWRQTLARMEEVSSIHAGSPEKKHAVPAKKKEEKLTKSEKEKLELRQSIFYLDKGYTPPEQVSLAKLNAYFSGARTKADVSAALREMGFGSGEADFLADKIAGDGAFLDLLRNIDSYRTVQLARDKTSQLYFVKDEAQMKDIVAKLEQTEKGTADRAALNFAVSRRYGSVQDVAGKMGVAFGKNDDETEVLVKMLRQIGREGVYGKIKAYEDKYGSGALDNLDIVGKHAFLKYSYPEMVRRYGSIFSFADYLKRNQLPSQIQYTVFAETIPRMMKGNTMEDVQTMTSKVAARANFVLTRSSWNVERQAYEFGTKAAGAIDRSDGAFLKRMINMALERPDDTDPALKTTGALGSDAMQQKTPVEATTEDIKKFLGYYAPQLLNEFDQLLGVEGVKTPEIMLSLFRKLMRGNLETLETKRGTVEVAIATDQALFDRFLGELIPVEPMPEVYTRQAVSGNGNYSYRKTDANGKEDKNASGTVYMEWTRWGPSASVSVYGSVAGNVDYTEYTVGSRGANLYRFGGYEVDYEAEVMTSEQAQQLQGYFDAYKGTANSFVHLYLNDDKDAGTQYDAVVYRKDGSSYVKLHTYKLTSDEAAGIFGGYVDYNKDARVLFEDGSLKGLLVGYDMSGIGLAGLKNEKQYSAIVASSSRERKIGARVYVDGDGAKQLGVRVETPRVYVDAAAGKEDEKTVYALDLKAKLDGVKISAIAARHMEQIIAAGVESKNAYFLLDYIDDLAGTKDLGVTAGVKIGENTTADLWWYDNGRAAEYEYGDGVTYCYKTMMEERKKLMDAMTSGNIDEVQDQLVYVNKRIDTLKTIIGEKVKRAFRVATKDQRFEYIGGDSDFLNFVQYGKNSSWRVNGSVGDVKSAEFTRVGIARAENEAASLISAGVLDVDDAMVLSGRYGRSTNPSKEKGSGWLAEVRAGKDTAELTAGYYKWNEPYTELTREYQAIIGKAGKSQENLSDFSLGYGSTKVTMAEGEKMSRTYYLIGSGAMTKDTADNLVKAMALEAGITLARYEIDSTQTLTGGLKLTRLTGYDKNGKAHKIDVYASGKVEWPIYTK